jgi:hypothetical protein
MELVRLVFPFEHRASAAWLTRELPIVLDCASTDTVMVAASLAGDLDECGVWLAVSSEYPAQIAARDVATLATMIPLRHVVIESSAPDEHAEVVRALLTDSPVDFSNTVATLRGAYNRPTPTTPITVWSYDGSLRSGGASLVATSSETTGVGELIFFEESEQS